MTVAFLKIETAVGLAKTFSDTCLLEIQTAVTAGDSCQELF
jgi:hypothetical protein